MNRLKQLVWAVVANFKLIDHTIVDKYLSKEEKYYFYKLSKSEQHHSIRVCLDAIKYYENENRFTKFNEYIDLEYHSIDDYKLAKIALLHDIGKTFQRLNVLEKSIMVILDKITDGRIKKYSRFRKVYIYYNHSIKSVELLKQIGNYDSEFIEAILNHHSKGHNGNVYLDLLIESDNKN